MPAELTSEAWTQIRHDYEHSDRPVEDICAEHGISSGTLRDRMRRWGWTRRRAPIPHEGPPPAPAPQLGTAPPPLPTGRELDPAAPSFAAAPQLETAAPCLAAVPQAAAGEHTGAPGESGETDDRPIVPRLQSAVARVLPAIETIVAKLGSEPMHPREMERAARALAALTRTLRELNNLLSQRQAAAADAVVPFDDMPEDIDAFRHALARRIEAFVASHTWEADGGAEPQRT